MHVCLVVSDSATPWTVAHQAPLSMGFPRQESWSGLPFPTPGDIPNQGIKLVSPALAGRFLYTSQSQSPNSFHPGIQLSSLHSTSVVSLNCNGASMTSHNLASTHPTDLLWPSFPHLSMPAALVLSTWSCPRQQAPAASPVDLLLAFGWPTMLPSQLPLGPSACCSTGSFLVFLSSSSSQAYLSLTIHFSLGKLIYSHSFSDQKLQEGRSLLGSLLCLWPLEQCLARSKWTILSPFTYTPPPFSRSLSRTLTLSQS